MRKIYPGGISCEQFEQIKDLLQTARKKNCSRTVDLYDVFCVVLYLLKGGCQCGCAQPENGVSLLDRY